ncbi:MAG: energy-coupling factor transporter ATPase [Syntrophomonadaceae bacterium]|jgi:energy-coupling factor transport system ATP-binding protein
MNTPGIELFNVSKKYAAMENPALRDVSLTIRRGEYVGLIGMNGSGKSTLVRLLNGLIQPSTGKVYIDGMDTANPKNLPRIRRRVGMVFQNPDNQLISPVVEEEISFGLENLGLPLQEINHRVEWALQSVGLADLRHHSPHLLSGGQKQKIALASVLAMRPEYLILDEPTSMLDPVSKQELLKQLRSLHSEGMTIILCSHDPEDLIQADRIIIIHQGFIYLQGHPREIFAQEEELACIGLESPGIFQLINQLAKAGHYLDGDIKTVAELVQSICPRL